MNLLKSILVLCFLGFALASYGQPIAAGTGMFVYSGYSPLRNKPLNVYYHIPTGNQTNMPVLMVFHGDDRDGSATVADWISAANTNGFMVFCPQFSDGLYPGGDMYNLANMFVDGDNPSTATQRPDSLWSFSQIDPLFLHIQQRTGNTRAGYIALGHSAGAQFIHRFHLYKPNALSKKLICANAGWYNAPISTISFPYGTGRSPSNNTLLAQAFAKPLIVQLGQQDRDPNSAGLRHTTEADAQGLYRYARGQYFFTNSQTVAQNLQTPFNWSKVEEAGLGHDRTGMARRAVPYVLDAFILTDAKHAQTKLQLTTQVKASGIEVIGLLPGATYDVRIHNTLGQLVYNQTGNAEQCQWLPFTMGSNKLLLLSISTGNGKQTFSKLIANSL